MISATVAFNTAVTAATAAVIGYVDYVVDSVAVRVIGGDALRIAEAVRRRRVDDALDDHRILRARVVRHRRRPPSLSEQRGDGGWRQNPT